MKKNRGRSLNEQDLNNTSGGLNITMTTDEFDQLFPRKKKKGMAQSPAVDTSGLAGTELDPSTLDQVSGGDYINTTITQTDDYGRLKQKDSHTEYFDPNKPLSSDPVQENQPLPLDDIEHPY